MPDRLGFRFGFRDGAKSLRPSLVMLSLCFLAIAYFVASDHRWRSDSAVLHAENDRSKIDRHALNERVRLLEDAIGRFEVQSRANHEKTRDVVREEFRKSRGEPSR